MASTSVVVTELPSDVSTLSKSGTSILIEVGGTPVATTVVLLPSTNKVAIDVVALPTMSSGVLVT